MAIAIKTTRAFSNDLLSAHRLLGDPPADAAIATVAEGGREAVGALMRWLGTTADLSPATQLPVIQQFFTDCARLPAWADAKRMQRGMAFFQQHMGVIGLALGTYSLPYTYLGADGVQLLWLTERIRTDTARRLQETGDWVFAVNDPKSWKGDRAIHYTLKIRLIHAAARWFAYQSGRWDNAWGVPVCQEDMVGTIGSFSYIVLRGLRKMGIAMTEQEEEDYMHHINVVGYINGVIDDLTPQNLREAFHLDKLMVNRNFRPSEAGRGLTKALLDTIGTVAGPSGSAEAARNLAAAQMRFFLGNDHADALGIPNVPAETRLMSVISRLPIFPKLIPSIK